MSPRPGPLCRKHWAGSPGPEALCLQHCAGSTWLYALRFEGRPENWWAGSPGGAEGCSGLRSGTQEDGVRSLLPGFEGPETLICRSDRQSIGPETPGCRALLRPPIWYPGGCNETAPPGILGGPETLNSRTDRQSFGPETRAWTLWGFAFWSLDSVGVTTGVTVGGVAHGGM